MLFNKESILDIVRHQLAVDMNCSEADFINDGVVFCEAALNEGRRLFERQKPYVEAATMGRGIVISADREVMPEIRPVIENKFRDDLFFVPFLFGHSLYYIPDCTIFKRQPCPEGFTFHVKEGREIDSLYDIPGFNNAIQYDRNLLRPDVLVTYAMKDGTIAGMAGASADSRTMWQIGIDVLPPYRNYGLAVYLVSSLADMIMQKGVVPYYGTASSNIASQLVAHRSGFMPAWMCNYKNLLISKA